MEGLTPGRIVHYVLTEHDTDGVGGRQSNAGEHRAAMVVSTNGNAANLKVFMDGPNDGYGHSGGTEWIPLVFFDERDKPPGTWHWIERA